jgi:nitrogen fixation/metabolism regulation signal transduction histidine kinase
MLGAVAVWVALAAALRRQVVFPLQTISNLIAALREGDFSVRGRQSRTLKPHDTLEELIREVNQLATTLHTQRLGAIEATALLGKVMEEIDVAVFTFDAEHRLKLLNVGAARLLALPSERAIGETAESLGLADYLKDGGPRLQDASFPGGTGRWEIRRSTFRQGGLPHQLLVLSYITRALR